MRIGIDARLVGRGLGIAHFVRNLVSHLEDEVEIVWFGDPELCPVPASVLRADRLPYPLLDTPLGRTLARRHAIDVMHFTANTGWARRGSPPFVLTVHDLLFLDSPVLGRSLRQVVGHRYVRHNVIRALAAADATATPSGSSASELAERAAPAKAPVVIPNGVDLPSDPDPQPTGEYVVAFSGRDPRKGVELAVAGWRAAGRVPRQLRLLAGAGMPPGLEGEIADDVRDGRIVVLPYLERADLHAVLAGALALVYPSRAEGFGLPVLEAMAAGVPVITGLAPATREIGGEAIVSIDPGDPVASIAHGLKRLSADPELVGSLAAAGRKRAERYSWAACARAYLELYRALAA